MSILCKCRGEISLTNPHACRYQRKYPKWNDPHLDFVWRGISFNNLRWLMLVPLSRLRVVGWRENGKKMKMKSASRWNFFSDQEWRKGEIALTCIPQWLSINPPFNRTGYTNTLVSSKSEDTNLRQTLCKGVRSYLPEFTYFYRDWIVVRDLDMRIPRGSTALKNECE